MYAGIKIIWKFYRILYPWGWETAGGVWGGFRTQLKGIWGVTRKRYEHIYANLRILASFQRYTYIAKTCQWSFNIIILNSKVPFVEWCSGGSRFSILGHLGTKKCRIVIRNYAIVGHSMKQGSGVLFRKFLEKHECNLANFGYIQWL